MGTTILEDLSRLWKLADDGSDNPSKLFEYKFMHPSEPDIDDSMYVGEWVSSGRVTLRQRAFWRTDGGWSLELKPSDNRGFLPLMGMFEALMLPQHTIIVVPSEAECEVMTEFLNRFHESMVCVCPFQDDPKRVLEQSIFKARNVIMWPENNENGTAWLARFHDQIDEVAESVLIADRSGYSAEFRVSTLLPEHAPDDAGKVWASLRGATKWTVGAPVLDEKNGFTSMKGYLPKSFINKVRVQLVDSDRAEILGNYSTVMKLADMDRAFDSFVKVDRATGLMQFHECYNNSYDEADNDLLVRLNRYGIPRPSKDLRYDIIKTLSLRDNAVVNSIHDAMNKNLAKYPNPQNRLDYILAQVKFANAENGAYIREIWDIYFRRAALHTFLAFSENPVPSDIVPVLMGGQGIGKSQFVRYLAMKPALFQDLGDKAVALGSSDAIRLIAGKLIVEFAEMSVFSRSEINVAKAFISQTVDEFRQLYERSTTKVPRTASFIGTTNEFEFLKDHTGNRRFFPMRVVSINYQYLWEHPEWIAETWAFYWKAAIEKPGEWYDVPLPVSEFFQSEIEAAEELPAEYDYILSATLKVEKKMYQDWYSKRNTWGYKNRTQLIVTVIEVGQQLVSDNMAVPRLIRPMLHRLLAKLGYHSARAKVSGSVRNVMAIPLDSRALLDRVNGSEEDPSF